MNGLFFCTSCGGTYQDVNHICPKAVYTVSPTPTHSAAIKHDDGKPDLSHISYELVEAVARVREFGAKKYARSNWKKGFKITRSCAAALRHIFQFLAGETNDVESGLSHLGHAVCCLEHAIYDMKHHPENDDRDKKETV